MKKAICGSQNFRQKNDITDKAAWEYLAHILAVNSGLRMTESKLEHVSGNYRTFFTKRFDRNKDERIHFSSAMTMTANHEGSLRDRNASYLEIAEFILTEQSENISDLHQLWRRIVFNIAISNTDDHLRNHGFLLDHKKWHLSPAYDLNPSVDKEGLALNIDLDNNDLDIALAKSVGIYFQLTNRQMEEIIEEVRLGTSQWRTIAEQLAIPRAEQERMSAAFTFDNNIAQAYYLGR
ncbi:type II toxin-antitoxin system HipA family toxin [Mucilaginibacter corticis]|uniref:type II toxin-antitoxin system HipA family toxin n=1 Tax=Mucilaginibacter corticis TaxID=2597670 RepID=UPI001FE93936|nr:HipA domain-containing protein [Mucilaginibacter corticis]